MSKDQSTSPNVLFFMVDQHHADCLSFMGHPIVRTPNLDKLAARGTVFNQMYTCSAICSPSRTSFFTGSYLRSHEHFCNRGDLRRPVVSMTEQLRTAGYHTGQCGKNHLPESLATQFHHCWTHDQQDEQLARRGTPEKPATDQIKKDLYSFQSQLPEADSKEAWTADRAIDFLQSDEANRAPFFLWCSFERPHPPISPPANVDDLYNPDDIPLDWEGYRRFEASRLSNRPMIEDFWKIGSFRQNPKVFQKALCRYFSLITLIDQEIGRVLETLETQGQADNTLIVFTADHGDWAGHWGQFGKNLAGYDDLLRIPFIYVDPNRPADSGRCVEGMYQSIDLFPTLMERLNLPTAPTCQGQSFLPALDGYPGSSRDYIFAESSMIKTVRSRNWKLNFHVNHPERGQLFKMDPDPDETNNLWNDPGYAHIKMDLLTELTGWMTRCEQPGSMEPKSEKYIGTRWYDWLSQQPDMCANAGNWFGKTK